MKNMNKRGQAALEFLTSYGWAILVVLVMIGALSSFGILSPGTFLPERCNIDPSFQCTEFNAIVGGGEDNGTINLILRNQLGLTITQLDVVSISIAGGDDISNGGEECRYHTDDTTGPESNSWGPGEPIWILCDNLTTSGWATVGSKENVAININYMAQGRSLDRTVTADLYVNVQQEN